MSDEGRDTPVHHRAVRPIGRGQRVVSESDTAASLVVSFSSHISHSIVAANPEWRRSACILSTARSRARRPRAVGLWRARSFEAGVAPPAPHGRAGSLHFNLKLGLARFY